MIRVAVSQDIREEAQKRYASLRDPKFFNSQTGGRFVLHAYVAELIFEDVIARFAPYLRVVRVDLSQYDYLLYDDRYDKSDRRHGPFRIDVKMNIQNHNIDPQADWNVSVVTSAFKQHYDYVVFLRVLENLSCAWIVGTMHHDRFFQANTMIQKEEAWGVLQKRARPMYELDDFVERFLNPLSQWAFS